MSNVFELFGVPTFKANEDWESLVEQQYCPYLEKRCIKIRKSQPEIAIGTCTVNHGAKEGVGMIICPHRFLELKQIFMDCIHLLTLHEPGNELHNIAEVDVPGGSIDYVLTSVRNGIVVDFVGIELQALDTTGTLWPHRQRFLQEVGVGDAHGADVNKPYGINWKMTAKTILVQLHHKTETFEHLGKHVVLVLQEPLLDYMRRNFSFSHVEHAKLGDSMQFHSYSLVKEEKQYRLRLNSRSSTNAKGIATCLGLQVTPNVEMEKIITALQAKISSRTRLTL
ncbi:NotI family restriction endonuclease [Candidatus Oscillochloris fontis]|uniref:NotI family restriction endonuclease n=1 Tax=Candidatus Oscillochloris fontis TaxID=2496868 RepID=UPI00101CCF2D|nr:NotI family restriction endonuclease [Candidatus Oscillochloris fontis]